MVSALDGTADLPFNWTGCSGCGVEAPPPDSILQIPPPPLPHFLQLTLLLEGSNHSSGGLSDDSEHFLPPCNPHCDWSNGAGVEYVELSGRGTVGAIDDTWFLVLIGSCVAFILLAALLAFALLKWKQKRNMKSQMEAAAKVRPLDNGHCCPQANDQHALWAALTSKGTPAHFAVPPEKRMNHGVDFCRPSAPGFGYYGAIEPHFPQEKIGKSQPGTPESQIYTEIPDVRMTKLSHYDDYAYEDLPIDSYPMAEVSRQNTLSHFGTARPLVSPPTKIDASTLPPLNQKRQRNLPNI